MRTPFHGILFISVLSASIVGCERLTKRPNPTEVPAGAVRDRRTTLWTLQSPDGTFRQYTDNGKIASQGKIVDGLRQGRWTTFGPDGKRIASEGNYKDDFRDGLWKFYDDAGVLYVTVEYAQEPKRPDLILITHDYGNENGVSERFFPDGRLEERMENRAGYADGPVVRYYRSGRKAHEGRFQEDRRTGMWRFYYPDGTVERTEEYKEGVLHGRVQNFLPDGRLYHESRWQDGRLVERNVASRY